MSGNLQRAAIVIVAYDASSTIEWVLDRIEPSMLRGVGAILVSDDASSDDTTIRARSWSDRSGVPIEVVRQPRNLGYGGNQKFCYRWAAEGGFEHVVMIHGDGQYAPELAGLMLRPLLEERADAVLGSRFLDPGGARRGGMPLYKFVGNRLLTKVQNAITGLELSEWHTGYRAYSLEVLAELDLGSLSDGFDFDTEIILRLKRANARIAELSIPTFYGDEVCHVNGLSYARSVVADSWRHRREVGRHALDVSALR